MIHDAAQEVGVTSHRYRWVASYFKYLDLLTKCISWFNTAREGVSCQHVTAHSLSGQCVFALWTSVPWKKIQVIWLRLWLWVAALQTWHKQVECAWRWHSLGYGFKPTLPWMYYLLVMVYAPVTSNSFWDCVATHLLRAKSGHIPTSKYDWWRKGRREKGEEAGCSARQLISLVPVYLPT